MAANEKISPIPKHWRGEGVTHLDPSEWPQGNRHFTAAWTEPVRIIAIDPGGVTGWSVMEFAVRDLLDPKVHIHDIVTKWWHGQIECGQGLARDGAETTEEEGIEKLNWLIEQSVMEKPYGVAVVIEDFIVRRFDKSRPFLSPVRITAPIQQMLYEMGLHHKWVQQPNDAKNTISDERLKIWDMYSADGLQHARDADRHALLGLRNLRSKRSLVRQVFPVLKL